MLDEQTPKEQKFGLLIYSEPSPNPGFNRNSSQPAFRFPNFEREFDQANS